VSGDARNAALSRAALLAAGGAALIGLNQQAAAGSPAGPVLMVLGGVVIAVALALAVRALLKRSGGADR
jgi:hypothetical protein